MLRATVFMTVLLSALGWSCSSDTTQDESAGGSSGAGGVSAGGTADDSTMGTGAAAGDSDQPTGGTAGDSGLPNGGTGGASTEEEVFDSMDRVNLAGGCLPVSLPPAGDDRVACSLLEVLWGSGPCDCSLPGRTATSDGTMASIREQEHEWGTCEVLDCDGGCACAIEQLTGSDLQACLHDAEPDPALSGFCVIDLQSGDRGNPDLVADCPESNKRTLRVLGSSIPVEDAVVYLDCRGQ